MVHVKINGQDYQFDREMPVETLLRELKFEKTDGLAVAINYRVASRNSFATTTVQDGDEVEIIRAVQGG